MAKADYYEVLGVSRQCGEGELKKVYRQLAMKWHPDRNPGDATAETKFKEISEAYEVLKDPQKRAAYDQFGHQAFEGGASGARGGFDFGSFADVFDDLFSDFVGGGRRRGGGARGADLRYNLTITLEEAFVGKKAQIRVPTSVHCEVCNGSGSAQGADPTTCTTCRGTGRVRAQQGFFMIERTCAACQGAGRVIADPCRACQGAGRVHKEKTLVVTVPQGVEDGTRIRLTGEGEAGLRGGQPGDLYIFVSIAPHRMFKREGTHLFCRAPIPMTVAALGGQVDVPTIDGKRLRMAVPEGTQTGKQIRLRGNGLTELQGTTRGDLFVEIVVETPQKLTKRQEELLREFEKEEAGAPKGQNPESEGFFARVKEFWDELRD
ncbi:molecular chaperone DnaJ [Arboricoccus pini]|uniref:Chaperone protein DnaJ n=1 Tax=Arboricoccus pini TaxID=1963835 RepID=A0A212S1K9_9PROT|nr:molecular chaperone DnaJ [Arboricoccus pini]SNB79025.1 molecular chaperone DnaJ [Arboricoccus pini]